MNILPSSLSLIIVFLPFYRIFSHKVNSRHELDNGRISASGYVRSFNCWNIAWRTRRSGMSFGVSITIAFFSLRYLNFVVLYLFPPPPPTFPRSMKLFTPANSKPILFYLLEICLYFTTWNFYFSFTMTLWTSQKKRSGFWLNELSKKYSKWCISSEIKLSNFWTLITWGKAVRRITTVREYWTRQASYAHFSI